MLIKEARDRAKSLYKRGYKIYQIADQLKITKFKVFTLLVICLFHELGESEDVHT